MSKPPPDEWEDLQVVPRFAVPGDPAYERLSTWPVRIRDAPSPSGIVPCASGEDVARALGAARRRGMSVAVRGGGHSFTGQSRTDGLLIDTAPMAAVELGRDVATVGAGVTLAQLYQGLHEAGRTIPAGCGPTVGVAGLALGGGLGVLGRLHGLTCDSLISAEVVLADGSLVRCGANQHPDLYWALRGGGNGTLGVATRLTLHTVPEPPASAFRFSWPGDQAPGLLEAWQEWLATEGFAVSPSLHLLVPGLPADPPYTEISGAAIGPARSTDLAIAGLLLGLPNVPEHRDRHDGPLSDIKAYLASPNPAHPSVSTPDDESWVHSEYFERPLPSEVIDRVVDLTVSGRRGGEVRELDFTPLGGGYAQLAPGDSAYVHRNDLFLLKYSLTCNEAAAAKAATTGRGQRWLDEMARLLAQHGTGRSYQNFPENPARDPLPLRPNGDRLLRVSDAYDPDHVFAHFRSLHGASG